MLKFKKKNHSGTKRLICALEGGSGHIQVLSILLQNSPVNHRTEDRMGLRDDQKTMSKSKLPSPGEN